MRTASPTSIKQVLNDLVLINNDRIAGYERAMTELKLKNEDADADLQGLFRRLIDESRDFKSSLGEEIITLGGDVSDDTTMSGKVYREWMDVKALFSGQDRQAILSSCEKGEQAAQKAYSEALGYADIPSSLTEMISNQKVSLKVSHDIIISLREVSE